MDSVCTTYFLSVPMRDKTREEIEAMIDEMGDAIVEWDRNRSTLIPCVRHAYNPDNHNMSAVRALGHSIMCMDGSDYVVFWNYSCYDSKYRGCNVEHYVALRYGMKCLNYNSVTKRIEELHGGYSC